MRSGITTSFARAIAVAVAAVMIMVGLVASSGSAFSGPSCGSLILKSNGTPWQCTFDDEFSTSSLNRTKWYVSNGAPTDQSSGTYACEMDNPNNVSVSNGALHLTMRKEAQPVACGSAAPTLYTTGQISTYRLFSQAYGRFETRMRTTATTAPGLQEDFWLWPDDRYTVLNPPLTGEIDIAETYSQYLNNVIPFLHYTYNDNGGPIPGTNTAWNCYVQRGVWNTYVLVWTPTSLTITVNGTTCLVNTSANVAFTERYIVAFSQLMGVAGNAPTAATTMPATTDVDYIRVWK